MRPRWVAIQWLLSVAFLVVLFLVAWNWSASHAVGAALIGGTASVVGTLLSRSRRQARAKQGLTPPAER